MVQPQSIRHAFLRGRSTLPFAEMEYNGIPIDVDSLNLINEDRERIINTLISDIDENYGVYEHGVFKRGNFAKLVDKWGIKWPETVTGMPKSDRDTFREMSLCFPHVKPLGDLVSTISKLKKNCLEVGTDGRNRTMLSVFSSRTGRNEPSTTAFIFSLPKWLRSLIKPLPSFDLIYADYEQQELGITRINS